MTTITKAAQYLVFRLEQEEYGIDVRQVNGILELTPVTKVPGMPQFITGVINMRGSVVPVVDMRLRLGMEESEPTVDSCIIILEIATEGGDTAVGALVDGVHQVIQLDDRQIEPPPSLGMGAASSFLRGVGKQDQRFVMILDVGQTVGDAEPDLIGSQN